MFDFGLSELLLIAVVALIVVGPERLPKVARTAGHLLGRLQRYVSDVKSDISREMQLEDLKKLQQQVEQQARELEGSVRSEVRSVEADLDRTAGQIEQDLAVDGSRLRLSKDPGAASPVPDTSPVETPRTEAAPADAPRSGESSGGDRAAAAAQPGPAGALLEKSPVVRS